MIPSRRHLSKATYKYCIPDANNTSTHTNLTEVILSHKYSRLSLNAIRQPSWNKIRICEEAILLPPMVLVLQIRLNMVHQMTIVFIDQVHSLSVVKLVAVVKQRIKPQTSQIIKCSRLDCTCNSVWQSQKRELSIFHSGVVV